MNTHTHTHSHLSDGQTRQPHVIGWRENKYPYNKALWELQEITLFGSAT